MPVEDAAKRCPAHGGVNPETFEKCSILVKVKESEDFNHRNILNISRINPPQAG